MITYLLNHPALFFAGWFLAIALVLFIWHVLAYHEEETQVEVEEYRDFQWPNRNVGPVSRVHVGRRP